MRRLLIVDDDTDIRDCLAQFFSSRGFTVVSAFSGEEAMEHLAKSATEVMLLDLVLPGISGFEVLQRAKTLQPSTRVVIVTAYDEPDFRQQAAAFGASAFIAKPFDFSDQTWAPVLSSSGRDASTN